MSDSSRNIDFIKEITSNQKIIHKICNMYCSDDESRKDLFQEILYQLWNSRLSFDSDKNIKFTTWMYRVALNTAITNLRSIKRAPKIQSLSSITIEEKSEEEYEENQQDFSKLQAAINELKSIDKAIILLYLEGKSYKEMSLIIGVSENTLGVKINRIKKKLKELLSK